MGRPRKPDKKLPLSFRASPELGARLERFATAMGSTTSEAVEAALDRFLQSELAEELLAERESARAAARRALSAENDALKICQRLPRDGLRLLREHLHGVPYRDLATDDLTPTEARLVVKRLREQLDEHYSTLVERPELLDHLLGRREQPPTSRRTR